MRILRNAKLLLTQVAARSGVSHWLLESRWRRKRLLILCYHGVSLDDEHAWSPGMYVSADVFRGRLAHLQAARCAVLPLGEAVRRLSEGTLPSRAVVITFDDGFFDFQAVAWPLLRAFSFPATVYLTTYYSQRDWPVFDLMLEYLLWKARGRTLDWPEIFGAPMTLTDAARVSARNKLQEHAAQLALSGARKDQLLAELAGRCEIDMDGLRKSRILHLMRPEEVCRVSQDGADVQLHTHRHRVFARQERFWQEIDENRAWIETDTGTRAEHFCYPGGFTLPEFPEWLRERGVISATTCNTGIACQADDPLLLPRVLDTNLADVEFASWITGFAALFPRRPVYPSGTQLGVEPAAVES